MNTSPVVASIIVATALVYSAHTLAQRPSSRFTFTRQQNSDIFMVFDSHTADLYMGMPGTKWVRFTNPTFGTQNVITEQGRIEFPPGSYNAAEHNQLERYLTEKATNRPAQ